MEPTTREKIMASAERLLRTRGYSDFSYADLVDQVGIRKASIHHHFATKEDLGVEIVNNYLQRFKITLDEILVRQHKASDRLDTYARLFSEVLSDCTLPLCTALAAELKALPPSMRTQTVHFFNIHLAWLEKVIDIGRTSGEVAGAPDPARAAKILLCALEGGAVVAWALACPEIARLNFDEMVALWCRRS